MHRLAAFAHRFAWVPTTLTCWFLMTGTLLAADEAKKPKTNNWTLAYILVLLGVALGLIIICRPGRRTKELPRESE
jgi:uncharacterized membrane protein HdeD (DUF308 family)